LFREQIFSFKLSALGEENGKICINIRQAIVLVFVRCGPGGWGG